MWDEDIIAMFLTFIVIVIPVAGLTLRFALRPLVDSVARLLEARTRQAGDKAELMDQRLSLIEQELQLMRHQLGQIAERGEFYDRLTGSR